MWYTLFKYLEVAILGVSMMVLAKKVGPFEMGQSLSSFLFVTYSAYLALGLNALIVKTYKGLSFREKEGLLVNTLQYFVGTIVLFFGLSYTFVPRPYFFLVFIIGFGTLIKSFFTSFYRVEDMVWVLNLIGVGSVLIQFLGVFFYVESWFDYLQVWLVSVFLSFFGYFLVRWDYWVRMTKKVFSRVDIVLLKANILHGSKLAIMGAISTIYLTYDRMQIEGANFDLDVKGCYQFADNISMAIFVGISSFIFYFTPNWIVKIKTNVIFRKKIITYLKFGFLLLIPILIVVYYMSSFLQVNWYPSYKGLELFTTLIIANKLLILLINVLGLIFMAFDMEKRFIVPAILIGILMVLTTLVIKYIFEIPIYMYPILVGVALTILFFYFLGSMNLLKKN